MSRPMRSRMGRRKRSPKGSVSSISVSVISRSPNCARRLSSRSGCGVLKPWNTRNTPNATPMARTMLMAMTSHLDLDDLLDQCEAHEHREATHQQHDATQGLAEHRLEVVGRDHREDARQCDGKQGDDPSRGSRPGGEGPDLALDADPLA